MLPTYTRERMFVRVHHAWMKGGEMLRHVSGTGEIVTDVPAAVAFYRDVLGLEVEHDGGEDYAIVKVNGTLHYGIWSRPAAAESVFGDRNRAADVPLGLSMGFEVDDVETAAASMAAQGITFIQAPKTEPWGQATARFILPGGGLGEICTTPWAREIVTPAEVRGENGASH